MSAAFSSAYRKLERTQMMMDVAEEALALRKEGDRISGDQLKAGLTSIAQNAEAVAATRAAEMDQLEARLSYELALAEIARITGLAAWRGRAVPQARNPRWHAEFR